ncbi:MAG: glycosyltransferase family 1 protein [Verrucomicrobia bacterium]|nr:MAG: glycosyltransferase family 1 protein [Verrucomicrobiota bacterium]
MAHADQAASRKFLHGGRGVFARRLLRRAAISCTQMKQNGEVTKVTGVHDLEDYSIIVHSHLKWDWVWQRPQQFLSRLSRKHRVLFVETPEACDQIPATRVRLREVSDLPNVSVLQIKIPRSRWSDTPWVDKERRRVLQSLLSGPLGQKFTSIVQWFYDPMAVTAVAGQLGEQLIVYDCMDELSLFDGAPAELACRERELLEIADIVFAGGPRIWRAKREFNPNCFCYGCGVDARHFGQARDPKLRIADELTHLPRPIFGYIGVVDERIDYHLIDTLADSTTGSVAIVGPSTKVDPGLFPRRDNLHWLGGRQYADLPRYAKAFDVCIMPFAMNEATRFINPTKALEYMATGRPIVSTAVEDVVAQFSQIITVAENAREFAKACERLAVQPEPRRIEHAVALAARNSWESIVARLERHIEQGLRSQRALRAHAA